MASALILAAGFGTRLRPLTLELPKPVVPLGDRPLLAHVAAACRRAGARKLIANLHHDYEKIAKIIEDLSLGIEVVVEPEIRGTAGGVAGARACFEAGQPVLVWNGDILTEASTESLLELARAEDAQVLLVSEREGGAGTVGLDREGNVVRLRGHVFGVEVRSADYVGIMALGPSIVSTLPERGCLIGDVALPALAAGQRIRTVTHGSPWTDLGDVASYLAANLTWLGKRRSWVGAGAAMANGVSLERAIVGVGAQVGGAGELSEVVVWPGARVTAPLCRAVVLGSGRVVPVAESAEN